MTINHVDPLTPEERIANLEQTVAEQGALLEQLKTLLYTMALRGQMNRLQREQAQVQQALNSVGAAGAV